MTTEIKREEWKRFFDDLSRDLAGWQTVVELLNDDTGAQVLADGLPFVGLTYEDTHGNPSIELTLGEDRDNHQTHTIADPKLVAFEGSGIGPAGVLDIEDAAATKTLIRFVQPFPILAEYEKKEVVRVATATD